MPAAILGAAVLLAVGLVTAALILRGGNKSEPVAANPNPTTANDADSSTCQAWKTTRAALDQITPLPSGWDWTTPNIDALIANRNAATLAILKQFTPQIAPTPAEVSPSRQ